MNEEQQARQDRAFAAMATIQSIIATPLNCKGREIKSAEYFSKEMRDRQMYPVRLEWLEAIANALEECYERVQRDGSAYGPLPQGPGRDS
jgi:hypothetical protein